MRSDQITNGIKLLVGLAGFILKPSALGSVKTALSSRDLIKKIMAKPPPDIKRLTDELTERSEQIFTDFRRDLPDDADVLYAQMVEFSLPSAAQIMEGGLDPDQVAVGMLTRLTASDYADPGVRDMFLAITTPALKSLFNNASFADSLTPAFMARVVQELLDQTALIEELTRQFGSLAKALEQRDQQNRKQLELFGWQFGVEDIDALSDHDLAGRISAHARELDLLRDQIALVSPMTTTIASLKAEAEAAAERLDFAAVEQALRQADLAETEAVEATKRARAQNALVRDDPTLAARILSATADSFGSLDLLDPTRKRLEYVPLLLDHGNRFGLPALIEAETMAHEATEAVAQIVRRDETTANQLLFADALSALAIARFSYGQAAGSDALRQSLKLAINEHRRTLKIYEQHDLADAVAREQTNLGNALATLALWTHGSDAIDLLGEAVNTYQAAAIHTDRASLVAGRLGNLGVAQRDYAMRLEDTTDIVRHLTTAQTNLTRALALRTKHDHDPFDVARTRSNLASVEIELGRNQPNSTGRDQLTTAIHRLDALQSDFPRETAPIQWATAEFNLATARLTRACHSTSDDPTAELLAAKAHCEAALEVFSAENARAMWARTHGRLTEVETALGRATPAT